MIENHLQYFAVFGAGVIALELGQAIHRLGVRTKIFGRTNLGPISDPELLSQTKDIFGAVANQKFLRSFCDSNFFQSDVNNTLPLLHEAADDVKIAGYNAVNYPNIKEFKRRSKINIYTALNLKIA